jgi:hypothetical protein
MLITGKRHSEAFNRRSEEERNKGTSDSDVRTSVWITSIHLHVLREHVRKEVEGHDDVPLRVGRGPDLELPAVACAVDAQESCNRGDPAVR